jgi:copper(I)-binding protein
VEDARLYLAFDAAQSGAAYMVIRNPGGPDDRLLSASSPSPAR